MSVSVGLRCELRVYFQLEALVRFNCSVVVVVVVGGVGAFFVFVLFVAWCCARAVERGSFKRSFPWQFVGSFDLLLSVCVSRFFSSR